MTYCWTLTSRCIAILKTISRISSKAEVLYTSAADISCLQNIFLHHSSFNISHSDFRAYHQNLSRNEMTSPHPQHITRNASWDVVGRGRSESIHSSTPTHTNKCDDREKQSRWLQHAKQCMLEALYWSKERGVQAIIRTKLQMPTLSSNIGPILRFCLAI